MISKPDVDIWLREAIPERCDPLIVRAVQEGVLVGAEALQANPFLNNLVGQDLRGHIRRAAVMYALYKFSEAGNLPFNAVMGPMPLGNWHFVELRSGGVRFHICRTGAPFELPARSPIRTDAAQTNQLNLFVPRDQGRQALRELYGFLMFGVSAEDKVTHVAAGAPDQSGESWLGYVNLMRPGMQGTGPDAPRPPTLDPKDRLRFREHIEAEFASKFNKKA